MAPESKDASTVHPWNHHDDWLCDTPLRLAPRVEVGHGDDEEEDRKGNCTTLTNQSLPFQKKRTNYYAVPVVANWQHGLLLLLLLLIR
jgi:hypothetical protein